MRHPVYYVVGVFCLLFVMAPFANAQQRSDPADAEALRQFKLVDLPRAYKVQDTTTLRSLLHDRYERIGFDGERSNKDEEIARAGRQRPTYDTLWFEIHRLDLFDETTAIVSGTGRVEGRDAQGAYRMSYLSSNVLLKVGGRWLLVNSHVSGRELVRPG